MRALEAMVAAGVTDVALAMGREYTFEWHQDSVHAHLHPFVVTPAVLDRRVQRRKVAYSEGGGEGGGGSGGARAQGGGGGRGDLNDREERRPSSKWDSYLAALGGQEGPPGPRITIMTFSTFSAMLAAESVAASSGGAAGGRGSAPRLAWPQLVRMLAQPGTVDTVIVDECSQLWEGHVATLMATDRGLPDRVQYLLVGDDRQMAPFGSSEVAAGSGRAVPGGGAGTAAAAAAAKAAAQPELGRSLFDAARECSPAVPITQLNTSYRLPAPLVQALACTLYGGDLQCRRSERRDAVVAARLRQGLDGLPASMYNASPLARRLLGCGLLCPTGPKHLLWVHVPGEGARDANGSRYNAQEAALVAGIAPEVLLGLLQAEAREGLVGGFGARAELESDWQDFAGEEGGEEEEEEEEEEEGGGSSAAAAAVAREEEGGEEEGHVDLSELLARLSLGGAEEAEQAAATARDISVARASAVESGRQRVRLAIITPYEAQRARIEGAVEQRLEALLGRGEAAADLCDWLRASRVVANVDSLQGQEADVTVVSLVRAPGAAGGGVGFLADNRRLNVMLSRAQQQLVIVGDAHKWVGGGATGSLLQAFAARAFAEGAVVECHSLQATAPPAGVLPLERLWQAPLRDVMVPGMGGSGGGGSDRVPAAASAAPPGGAVAAAAAAPLPRPLLSHPPGDIEAAFAAAVKDVFVRSPSKVIMGAQIPALLPAAFRDHCKGKLKVLLTSLPFLRFRPAADGITPMWEYTESAAEGRGVLPAGGSSSAPSSGSQAESFAEAVRQILAAAGGSLLAGKIGVGLPAHLRGPPQVKGFLTRALAQLPFLTSTTDRAGDKTWHLSGAAAAPGSGCSGGLPLGSGIGGGGEGSGCSGGLPLGSGIGGGGEGSGSSASSSSGQAKGFAEAVRKLVTAAGGSLHGAQIGERLPVHLRLPPQVKGALAGALAQLPFLTSTSDKAGNKTWHLSGAAAARGSGSTGGGGGGGSSALSGGSQVGGFAEVVRQMLTAAGGSLLDAQIGDRLPAHLRRPPKVKGALTRALAQLPFLTSTTDVVGNRTWHLIASDFAAAVLALLEQHEGGLMGETIRRLLPASVCAEHLGAARRKGLLTSLLQQLPFVSETVDSRSNRTWHLIR